VDRLYLAQVEASVYLNLRYFSNSSSLQSILYECKEFVLTSS
jgi:hypothetical protein